MIDIIIYSFVGLQLAVMVGIGLWACCWYAYDIIRMYRWAKKQDEKDDEYLIKPAPWEPPYP